MRQRHWTYLNPETGEYAPEFRAFYDAIGEAGCPDYDCEQAAQCFDEGLTPAEAAVRLNAERVEMMAAPLPYDPLDHDMSMNA